MSPLNFKAKNYCKSLTYNWDVNSVFKLQPRAARPWFTATEIAKIYNIPKPSTSPVVVGVVSFGGSLYGNINADGVLTNGDVQNFWTSLGITDQPRVIVRQYGTKNTPNMNPDDGTGENTLDVEMIGACCPTSKLTIILYIFPNTMAGFIGAFNTMINIPVKIGKETLLPSVISVSWGCPEIYLSKQQLIQCNGFLEQAKNKGIAVCVATGDLGSNNGIGGKGSFADFPSSSSNVVAVGGTSLVCPNKTYDASTKETAWLFGGGAVSATFDKPGYQTAIPGTKRATPDIALNADPNTGVAFLVDNKSVIYGGTSVAAPTFAGLLAANNQPRFMNQLLYTINKTVYNDITIGTNGGFRATNGWDNCTGFGSVKGGLFCTTVNKMAIRVAALNVYNPPTVIKIGEKHTFNANVQPRNATNQKIDWESSDATIVSIQNNVVTALKVGKATITATAMDNSKFKQKVNIEVTA